MSRTYFRDEEIETTSGKVAIMIPSEPVKISKDGINLLIARSGHILHTNDPVLFDQLKDSGHIVEQINPINPESFYCEFITYEFFRMCKIGW